jgi:hypothetical protein
VQSDVNFADVLERGQREIPNVKVFPIPRGVNKLIPQLAEVVLELWQRIPGVELANGF